MRYIKGYNIHRSIKFDLSIVNTDVNESMSIWHDVLLDSIGFEELDISDTF